MTYTVTSFDGDFEISSLAIDTTSTALTLPGKNISGWGEPYTNNFVHLLENFAKGEPAIKRTGMLWYDTNAKALKVWNTGDDSWKGIGETSDRLTTPRAISISGDAVGTANFDGSADISIDVTLGATGVTAGNYLSANITVGADGRITSASTGLTGNDQNTPVTSFNGRIGDVTLTNADVTAALGYSPTQGGITSLNAAAINSALGYTAADNNLVVHKTGDTMLGALNMNNQRITNLPAPLSGTDAARKSDVDALTSTRTQRNFNGTGETTYNVTVSSNAPSGGNDGDVWYKY